MSEDKNPPFGLFFDDKGEVLVVAPEPVPADLLGQGQAMARYEELLLRLHAALREGATDEAEDAIRDEMDLPGRLMTKEEREQMAVLSTQLWLWGAKTANLAGLQSAALRYAEEWTALGRHRVAEEFVKLAELTPA